MPPWRHRKSAELLSTGATFRHESMAPLASGSTSDFDSEWKKTAVGWRGIVSRLHRRWDQLGGWPFAQLGGPFLAGQPELVVDLLRDFSTSRLERLERWT